MKDPKIKGDDYIEAIFSSWVRAFDKHNDIGSINFKRDVYPEVGDLFGKKYPAVLRMFREKVVPAMANFMVNQMGGRKSFYERLIISSDSRPMHERIAEDFFLQRISAWMMEPAIRIEKLLRRAYAKL